MSKTSHRLTVNAVVKAPVEQVWDAWITPKHIKRWNAASDDWHTLDAKNDFRVGGEFHYRMEAKDKSTGFDFWGTYSKIIPDREIAYTMGDGQHAQIIFEKTNDGVKITETFEPETENSEAVQRGGWQAIMDRFKAYVESGELG